MQVVPEDLLKKVGRIGVGARPAALDEIDPQFVKFQTDPDLVFNRQVEVLGLGSVPQGGIVHRHWLVHVSTERG